MASTMAINELNGVAPGTATNVASSNLIFGNSDAHSPGNVVRVEGGTAYSFKKYLRLRATGGTWTTISNPQFYTTGTGGLSTGCVFWLKNAADNTYVQPVAATATDVSGGVTFANHLTGTRKRLDTISYGSGSTNAGSWPNSTYPAPVDIGDLIICFAVISSTAAAGTMGTSTMTWVWDET